MVSFNKRGGEQVDPKLLQVLRDIETGKINSAHIYELIDTYYQCVIYKNDGYEESKDTSYPEELLKPLSERDSGIAEVLSALIKQGFDVHESDGCFNALMLAVGSADEPMTAFLLANGADPHTWPDMDELPEERRQNYYLEDIDIHYMDACYDHDKDYKAALVRTAQTFVKMSGLKKFGGLCLLLTEDGTVSLEPPKKKY